MKQAGKISAGFVACMMSAGVAVAADAPQIVMPVMPAPVAAAEPAFDWGGFYLGARGGAWIDIGEELRGLELLGVGGYDIARDRALFGLSAYVGYNFGQDGSNWRLGADVRAGLLVGESRRLLIYTLAGIYDYLPLDGPDDLDWRFGGGAELALGRALSIYGQVTVGDSFGDGFPPGRLHIEVGLNWHPGN